MLITVTCPFCGKRSKIKAEKQGKKLRCPYADCRQSFTVPTNGEGGSLGESAAVVEQPLARPAEPSWEAAPPPVRQPGLGQEPEAPAWEPPPVQAAYDPFAPAPQAHETAGVEATPAPVIADLYAPVRPRHRKSKWVMLLGVLMLGVVCLMLVPFILRQRGKGEEKRDESAVQKFEQGSYGDAERLFKALAEDYPSSERRPTWEFMTDISHICAQAGSSTFDVKATLSRVNTLAKKPKVPERLKAHRGEVWDAAMRLGSGATTEAERQSNPDLIQSAAEFLKLARDVGPGKHEPQAEKRYAELESKMAQARVRVNAALAKAQAIKAIEALAAKDEPQIVEQAEVVREAAVKDNPSLSTDGELSSRIADLKRREPQLVRYHRDPKELPRGPVAGGGRAPALIVCPVVAGNPGPSSMDDGIVFALVRGVLYALSQKTGEPRWFMRVGIDMQTLPARLPAEPPLPEMALVFSTETNTLSAVEVQTGKTHWHFQMQAPSTAAPVLDGRTAFVPTIDGKLHEISTTSGRLEGHFETGQPLTLPGVYDPSSQRLYIPADKKRIYILDVGPKKTCEAVFYSNHPVGGLRAPPIVVGKATDKGQTLVLIEATDLQTTQVRGFTIPRPGAEAKLTEVDYPVTGWSWFPPFFDGETLGLATDRGVLALFGVNRGTEDKALFPLTKPLPDGRHGLIVDAQAYAGRPFGRAQVVDSHLNEWWLLIGGQLRRFRFDMYRRELSPVAGAPLALGTPLHDRQTRFGDRQIVLVSQENDHRCVVTSIDSVRGGLQWQRQLGLTTGEAPLRVGDKLVAMDQSGGLLLLDPARQNEKETSGTAGDWLANGLDPSTPPVLLRSPNGQFAVAVIYLAATDQLVVRRIEPGKGVTERVFPLLNAPAGMPAVTDSSVLLPCRDGNFYELLLDGPPEVPIGLVWRDRNAPPGAAGHALAIAPDQVLISDGWRTLARWQLGGSEGNRQWRRQGGIELPARLTAPPLLFTDATGEKSLCLADESGTVHLRPLDKPAGGQEWRLGDLLKNEAIDQTPEIVRGPFACGARIGVIVRPGRFVVLDPKATAPAWEFAAGKGGIAGAPQPVGSLVLVAEVSGRFVWLDAAKGSQVGELGSGEVVPTAGGVPFGPGRALAPLTDGTLLVLAAPK